jgi:hypothetical protein
MALRTSSMVVVVAASLTLVACSSNGEETTTVDTTPSTTVAPITTEASTTTVESTVAPTSGVTTVPPERPYSLWEEVAPPVLPVGHTTPFVESGELLDGAYWVDLNASTAQAPDVTVSQAFFGAECEEVAVQMGDECLNDVYVLSAPNRIIDDLLFAPDAIISVSNPNTQASFGITPEELLTLPTGSPSAGAPADYLYVPFGWLMTVVDGFITRFEQVWTP